MDEIDDALSRLVVQAQPRPAADPAAVEEAWAVIEAELGEAVVVPLRRPNRWQRASVVGAVALVALSLSAGATFIATRTGDQIPPDEVAAAGPGEVYRLDGTDFAEQLGRLSSDIPFPDEKGRQDAVDAIVDDLGGTEGAAASTGALRAYLARGALCAWTLSWLSADNDAERVAATNGLRSSLAWPAITDVDPAPSMTGRQGNLGDSETVFGYVPGIIEHATAGDSAALRSDIEVRLLPYCPLSVQPPRPPRDSAEGPPVQDPSESEPQPTTAPTPTAP